MATSSVSKGCFVFKPNLKKRKTSVPIEEYFNKGKNESEDSKLRFETYQLIWQQMKSETEQLQEEFNKNLFDSLIKFLQKSHSGFQKNSRDWGCQIKLQEIPTAALILGVNVTDHDLTFRSLTEALQNNVTPYVVSLQARDCPDMKHFLQKVFSQLMDCHVDVESQEQEKDIQKKIHCSMDSLSNWYMNVTQKTDPGKPGKKRTSSSQWQSPPVVLILKDMESFTTKVLQDFIIISRFLDPKTFLSANTELLNMLEKCTQYRIVTEKFYFYGAQFCEYFHHQNQHLHEFPLILIFGIATSPIIIHRLLPHAVSSLLCIEIFQSLSCKEHLTTVLDKLLLTTQFPFKLSEKVLQILISIFLYYDFSIQNFIKGLQLSLLEHFYSQPLSVLCCNLPEAKGRINFLSDNQCENIRRLPSFRRYVEKQAAEKQVALLTSERFLKGNLLENYDKIKMASKLSPGAMFSALFESTFLYSDELNQCFANQNHLEGLLKQISGLHPQSFWVDSSSFLAGFQEETQSLLENLQVYHTNYFLILRCLHQFTSSLPKYPLGRQIRELYCTCLEKNVWDSEEYASALQLLRMLAKDELMTILQKCFNILKSSSEKQLGSSAKRIEELLAQFQSLDAEAKEEEDTSESQSKGLQKTDLYHLQKSLLEMKELRRTGKKQTKFELLREKVVNFIDGLVREHLLPPETQPLHEVVYFTAAHTLHERLNAAPRIALHTALNNPYYYLKNEALKSEEGCIPSVAPDICIAYKLHLECSRLINLVDWSEAFATVVTAAEKTDASSVTSEERNEIIHARFIRAVSELELLGFIKPTKRKADHVARLTWGGC